MNLGAQLGPMSITKLSPNWACQMGPIHCPKFLLSGETSKLPLPGDDSPKPGQGRRATVNYLCFNRTSLGYRQEQLSINSMDRNLGFNQWCSGGNAGERRSPLLFTLCKILARMHFLLQFLLQFPGVPPLRVPPLRVPPLHF